MYKSNLGKLAILILATLVYGKVLSQDIGGGRVQYGETVSQSLTIEKPRDEWVFRAQAGDLVSASIQTTDSFEIVATLYDQFGLEFKRASWHRNSGSYVISETFLPASGPYTIVVRPRYQNYSGQYSIRVSLDSQREGTLEPITGGPVSYGEAHAGHLYEGNQQGNWPFAGERGDKITIFARSITGVELVVELWSDAGIRTAWSSWDRSLNAYVIENYMLPQTGTYFIAVVPRYRNTAGYYNVWLQLDDQEGDDQVLAESGGEIEYGQLVVGEITGDVFRNNWEFGGERGDLITVQLNNLSYFDTPDLQLLSASGEVITDSQLVPNSNRRQRQIWRFELPDSGRFTLQVGFRRGGASGYYELLVVREAVIPIISNGGTIVPGETRGGEFTETNTLDEWTFEGQSGNTITVFMKRLSNNLVCDFELRDPNGNSVAIADPSPNRVDAELIGFVLPLDGTYTIMAQPFSRNQTGIYSISISVDVGS